MLCGHECRKQVQEIESYYRKCFFLYSKYVSISTKPKECEHIKLQILKKNEKDIFNKTKLEEKC